MKKIVSKYRRSKGFTLVELLIVIIIIGILAGMLMLSTGAATDKAEATKIISNMRNAKAGALIFYADNSRWPLTADEASVDAYLDTKLFTGTGLTEDYSIVTVGTKTDITYSLTDISSGIKNKLQAFVNDGAIAISGDILTMQVKQ